MWIACAASRGNHASFFIAFYRKAGRHCRPRTQHRDIDAHAGTSVQGARARTIVSCCPHVIRRILPGRPRALRFATPFHRTLLWQEYSARVHALMSRSRRDGETGRSDRACSSRFPEDFLSTHPPPLPFNRASLRSGLSAHLVRRSVWGAPGAVSEHAYMLISYWCGDVDVPF